MCAVDAGGELSGAAGVGVGGAGASVAGSGSSGAGGVGVEKVHYTLPDGSVVDIGAAKYRAAEVLFRPELLGDESDGVHEVLANAIRRADLELRRTLYSNIVLSGGSTLFRGFGDRLLTELKRAAPRDVKLKIAAPQERLYSTWIGGSILASLETFKKMWVAKRDWDADGARIIHRKMY